MGAVTVRVNDKNGVMRYVRPRHRRPLTIIRNLTVVGSGTVSEKSGSNNSVARATLTLLVTVEEAKLLEEAKPRGPMTFTLAGAGWVSQAAPNPAVR
jgi:Flp pilus assembly protein CpaB